MRAGESFLCADCGNPVRRGEPCTVYHGRWTHASSAACLPLAPRAAARRPYVPAGAVVPRAPLPGLTQPTA